MAPRVRRGLPQEPVRDVTLVVSWSAVDGWAIVLRLRRSDDATVMSQYVSYDRLTLAELLDVIDVELSTRSSER